MESARNQRIFTIPNLLSMFRILLIPLLAWLCLWKHAYLPTLGVLALSGLTDVADGFIARRFNMISDLGKVLDPIADKLTQAATLLCLAFRFAALRPLLALLVIKELIMGILGLVAIRRTGVMCYALWHGKMTTALLYASMALHLLWPTMSPGLSIALAAVCAASMLLSLTLYCIHWTRALHEADKPAA